MEKPLNCVIVDDEPKSVSLMSDLVNRIPELKLIQSFNDPCEALVRLPALKPDLVFLDIEMPGCSGLELAKEIHAAGSHPFVVFTTGHDQYVIEAIRSRAFDYLLKPIGYQELMTLVARVLTTRHQAEKGSLSIQPTQRVKFNTINGFFIIDIASIIYIEADGNYSTLFLNTGEKRTVTVKIGDIDEMQLSPQFIRTGRSHILNLHFLSQVDRKKGNCVLKINGFSYTIPLNRQGIKLLSEVFEKVE